LALGLHLVGFPYLRERLAHPWKEIITQKLMKQENELEADKPTLTENFLPSDGAACYASFTPGPWVFGAGLETDEMAVKSASGHWICFCFDEQPGKNKCNANGALIAAAPDLLAACEEALRRTPFSSKVIGPMLAAAIAKARRSS
jgi:hypothetical protein